MGQGEKSVDSLLKMAEKTILEAPSARIDYVNICDPDTLEDLTVIGGPALMAMAVFIGKTRLIDNKVLEP